MQIPELTTRITVLCDCTEDFIMYNGLGLNPWDTKGSEFITTNFSPISAKDRMYELFTKIESEKKNCVVVLGSITEVMALCTILANSALSKPIEEIPTVPLSEIKVWEVFDNENILISKPDGMVTESSYDGSLRPIVADYQEIQARAFYEKNPQEEKSETTQFVETEESSEEGKKSVSEVLSERKDKARRIKEELNKHKEYDA